MNKAELVDKLAKESGSTKAEAGKHLDVLISVVQETLANGDDVVLVGFGTFKAKQRNARTGRNPQSGGTVEIPAKTVPTFKAGAKFVAAVNK